MVQTTNARVIFNSIPEGFPVPGKTVVYDASHTIDRENVPLGGGFLIKTLVLSIDPYMRGRMREPHVKSYAPPFLIGKPLDGWGISVVLRSESPDVKAGQYLYGIIPHQEYTVLESMKGLKVIEKHPKLSWTVFTGAAGMAGKTAWMGWKEYSRAKKGEIAFVTAGAGPVGSMVIQLAKRDGLKVIASAGSAEKVKFLKDLGADVAFNYKETNTREVLAKEGPINLYWDNVGGDTLDAALEHAAVYAHFLMCGTISGYNGNKIGVMNVDQIFAKSLTLNGLLIFHLEDKWDDEFYATVPPLIAAGELKYSEDVSHGLESVGEMILKVQKGYNKGKAVVVVAEE